LSFFAFIQPCIGYLTTGVRNLFNFKLCHESIFAGFVFAICGLSPGICSNGGNFPESVCRNLGSGLVQSGGVDSASALKCFVPKAG
jgi:hypothetical protein